MRLINNPYVFAGKLPGKRQQDLPQSWEDYLDKAGIEDFHWHDLRHTFASRLVMAGIDLYTVMKLLGHSSLKMTQRYAHLSPDYLKSAVGVLDREESNRHQFRHQQKLESCKLVKLMGIESAAC